MKALVGAFNQEKALVGAFSVIVQPVVESMDRFTALSETICKMGVTWYSRVAGEREEAGGACLGAERECAGGAGLGQEEDDLPGGGRSDPVHQSHLITAATAAATAPSQQQQTRGREKEMCGWDQSEAATAAAATNQVHGTDSS